MSLRKIHEFLSPRTKFTLHSRTMNITPAILEHVDANMKLQTYLIEQSIEIYQGEARRARVLLDGILALDGQFVGAKKFHCPSNEGWKAAMRAYMADVNLLEVKIIQLSEKAVADALSEEFLFREKYGDPASDKALELGRGVMTYMVDDFNKRKAETKRRKLVTLKCVHALSKGLVEFDTE